MTNHAVMTHRFSFLRPSAPHQLPLATLPQAGRPLGKQLTTLFNARPVPSARLWCSLLLLAVLPLTTIPVGADDWPQWRGPQRTGISAESGWLTTWPDAGPKVLWKASVGKGFSSFAIAKGRVYIMGNRDDIDTIFCFDTETGREIWKHVYPCQLYPKAFEGGPLSTPTVDGDRVYTLSKFGDTFCLDAQTGRVIWQRKFNAPAATRADYAVWWGFAGSILVSGDKLILPVGTAGLALDKLTGKTLWDNGPGYSGYSSPVPFTAGSQPCFALVSGHEVVAAAADTGHVLWRLPWKTTWDQNAADVIVFDNKLFVSSGHGVGSALFDISSGQPVQIWRNKNMRNFLSSSVLWKGALYGFDDKQLSCLDWKTGDVRWTLEDTGLGSLILADGKLIALQESGRLLIIEASTNSSKPLARAQPLSGRCWATPVLSGGRIYLRNALGDVVCLDVRH